MNERPSYKGVYLDDMETTELRQACEEMLRSLNAEQLSKAEAILESLLSDRGVSKQRAAA